MIFGINLLNTCKPPILQGANFANNLAHCPPEAERGRLAREFLELRGGKEANSRASRPHSGLRFMVG